MKAIILAAGIGKRLRKKTTLPKCLIKIGDSSLLARSVRFLSTYGVREIAIVAGYKKNKIIAETKKFTFLSRIKIINNPRFRKGSILSLWAARDYLRGEVFIMDADLYFDSGLIKKIIASWKKNFFLIDKRVKNDAEAVMVGFKGRRAVALSRGLKGDYELLGEWAGFLKLSPASAKRLRMILKRKILNREYQLGYEFVMPELFKSTAISYELTDGLPWVEIDFPEDIRKAQSLCLH